MAKRGAVRRRVPALGPHVLSVRPRAWWRVHSAAYRPAQFHPGGSGDARFSPIHTAAGVAIPTLYAASTLVGALMESVFHDVPTPPGDAALDLGRVRDEQLVVSRIRPKRVVRLVDLSTKGLKRLGLTRAELIDTPVSRYPETRARAVRFHGASKAQGLTWISRQDDEARALVLFGDRIEESDFGIELDRESLLGPGSVDAMTALARRIGITRFLEAM
jgi:hypothetical protein